MVWSGFGQVLTHAEAYALMTAWQANGGSLPTRLILYVDRDTCPNCKTYLRQVMKALGITNLTIWSKSGKIILLTPVD